MIFLSNSIDKVSVTCYIVFKLTKCQLEFYYKGDYQMREVKDPEVRKTEILEAAKNLFYKKGYLNTTTQDIIKELNISRGLLYYHFKSKEDILFSIVEKHIEPLLSQFRLITYDKELSVKDKVISFVNSTIISESSAEEEDYALQNAIELPENSFMMDKINHKLSYAMTKYFTEIIKEGNKEGIFHVEYPEELSAYLMTAYTFVIGDKYFHNNDIEKATKYLNAFKQLLNQTLGSRELLFHV